MSNYMQCQGRSVVVVDAEPKSNIYSPNIVPGEYSHGNYFRNL